MPYRTILAAVCIGWGLFTVSSVHAAGRSDDLVVRVAQGQSVREIARRYLDDPDRWTDLLHANGLKSAHEVKPGMLLKIPAATVFDLENRLEEAKHLIQKANAAGARLFAPQLIATSIEDRDAAVEHRHKGEFAEAIERCRSASLNARKAYDISHAKQHSPAEAVVQNYRGQVHRRKPTDNFWKPVSRFDLLQEGEKLRTLSQSFAEIVFRDNSRLHLSENAQALIQRMRANLLDNSDEAKVSLIKGDVLALLSNRRRSAQFQLDVPGVDTKIKSQHFWIGRDNAGARFANYDGEMEISSGGGKVTLAKNQGTVVPKNKKPQAPRQLLGQPVLVTPDSQKTIPGRSVDLEWRAVRGATSYLLEISRTGAFSEVIFSKETPRTHSPFPKQLGLGAFYWRVKALSADKLPGRPSQSRFVWVMDDRQPPFLVLQSPIDGASVTGNVIEVKGLTEDDVRLNIQGQLVDVQPGGQFLHWLPIDKGANVVLVKAVDPFGNESSIKRRINRVVTEQIPLQFASTLFQTGENQFKIGQREFVLEGTTCAQCIVRVSSMDRDVPATTAADPDGRFKINLRMSGDRSHFDVVVSSPGQAVIERTIAVEIDDQAPKIQLKQEIPPVTSRKILTVAGIAEDASYLELNGEILPLTGQRFHRDWYLSAGHNRISLMARDAVGNVTAIEKQVHLDTEPPLLLRHKVAMPQQNGGHQASIDIWVKDATGMKKTARFTVQIGDFQYNGHLILTGDDGRYHAAFVLPENVGSGPMRLQVELADYLGNRRTYDL